MFKLQDVASSQYVNMLQYVKMFEQMLHASCQGTPLKKKAPSKEGPSKWGPTSVAPIQGPLQQGPPEASNTMAATTINYQCCCTSAQLQFAYNILPEYVRPYCISHLVVCPYCILAIVGSVVVWLLLWWWMLAVGWREHPAS